MWLTQILGTSTALPKDNTTKGNHIENTKIEILETVLASTMLDNLGIKITGSRNTRRPLRLLAEGNTYSARQAFKACGWKWDGARWAISAKNYDIAALARAIAAL